MYPVYQYRPIKIGPINTSEKELNDLLKAWTAISLAFTIMITRPQLEIPPEFPVVFLISAFTVGLGFLFHELSHKIMAQRYGCFAEFRSADNMLLLAVLVSFMGFVIAAPGAVMISGYIDERKNGKISAMGPASNLLLAAIFLMLSPFIGVVGTYGFMINSWLAFFNLLPIGNFDGLKIARWNRTAYWIMLIVAIMFVFF